MAAIVEHDLAARSDDSDRLAREFERVIDVAMLERDVRERQVERVRRLVERTAILDVQRTETIDPTETRHGLVAPFEEPVIEVGRDHGAEFTREGAGHPADAATDLDHGALLIGRFA